MMSSQIFRYFQTDWQYSCHPHICTPLTEERTHTHLVHTYCSTHAHTDTRTKRDMGKLCKVKNLNRNHLSSSIICCLDCKCWQQLTHTHTTHKRIYFHLNNPLFHKKYDKFNILTWKQQKRKISWLVVLQLKHSVCKEKQTNKQKTPERSVEHQH